MKKYHKLENEILALFKDIIADENNKELTKFLGIFQKYWKSYQDNWSSIYWEMYNLVYEETIKNNDEAKGNEINKNNPQDLSYNKFKINVINDYSFVSENEFKLGIEQEKLSKEAAYKIPQANFLIDENSFLSNKSYKPNKYIINATKDQTKSITNLDDIDRELDGVLDKSIIRDVKNDKNRNCLDCLIL